MSNNKDIPSVPNPQSHSAYKPHARFRGTPHFGRRFTVTVAVMITLAVMALAGITMAIAWGSGDHHETAFFRLAAPGPSRRALPQPKGSKQSGRKTV
ncbi:hypothetical protein [Bifidobacterium leontopitheci]|uniref:hypothetical protein n=1 Tax=Bifidobacterium leontopitheci TaxID=2650774 RepID=UPI00126433DF|nr:hypothetical protein [Bifidobacterium leontopitheci]